MEYLSVLIDLKRRPVLVVGGGLVAARKVRMLNCAGAKVKIIAHTLCAELLALVNSKKINWISKQFSPQFLSKIFLVIVATDDKNLNALIYCIANKQHILVNVVDDQSKCSFIFPAIINRDPIIVSISSCGRSPVLTRILREKFESLLPSFLSIMASLAGSLRSIVRKRIVNILERRRFWENMFHGVFADLVAKGQLKQANKFFFKSLNSKNFIRSEGSISLVGAGPGDSGLLTLRGLQLMQQADVVLYDSLVSQEVLNMVRRDATCICVGKRFNDHSVSQNMVNHLLVKLANEGNRVVRLKGGDPFIFGRGGEELQEIALAGISFQVVPGITAASGASAYTGIPLTHRNYSHSVIFISGHLSNDYDKLNWRMLSCSHQTLVVYMGIMNISKISSLLIYYGRDARTPVAIVSRATCKDQQVLVVQLEQLKFLSQSIVLPALLIIGEVVSLYVNMNWYGWQDFKNYEFNSVVKLF